MQKENTDPLSLFNEMKLSVSTVKLVNLKDGWNYAEHSDAYSRLYILQRGQARIQTGTANFTFVPGHVCLIPGFIRHSVAGPPPVELFYVHFNLSFLPGFSAFDFYRNRECIAFDSYQDDIDILMAKTLKLSGPCSAGEEIMARGALLTLTAPFMLGPKPGKADDFLQRVLGFKPVFEYVDQNIGRHIKVGELAGLMGMERAAFSRAFARVFQKSPREFLQRKRIETAALLLIAGMSCEEAANATGFYDMYHLSRVFLYVTGIRPTEYRRRFATD